ncbi:MAG TPA: nitroreductase family protein [Anaerolineales bacterium]|nr:nitroreductase family protein [Anaerolineales bacterium]
MAEFEPLTGYPDRPDGELRSRAAEFLDGIRTRRTVRDFSNRPVDRETVEICLRAAGTAPSGANLQPWQFVVVSDAGIKRRIRIAAEAEEREFYLSRATPEWLAALEKLGTDAEKGFLEKAPFLIAIFHKHYDLDEQGRKIKNYYAIESVGIATGFLIAALHHAGLATLTHTPSPMSFLNEILDRPSHERPFLLLVVGHPAEGGKVPRITKKTLEEIAVFK